jgi:nucleotide-binding universal stress UspA family protein
VTGDDRADNGFEPPRYHHILVALDDSPVAASAFHHAVGIAREQHARLTLVTVVPSPSTLVAAAGIAPHALQAEMQAEAAARLRALAAEAPEEISLTTVVRDGDPAEEILALLHEEPFDLLCMGARGRGWLATTVLGSVSATVLHRSPTSMMVLHPAPAEPPT